MRYDTVGDFWVNGAGTDCVEVQEMNNPLYERLIAFHEEVEFFLCKLRGITCEQVDEWDFNFKGTGEPGDHPNCVYLREHTFASKIEKLLCEEAGVDWNSYNSFIEQFNFKGESNEERTKQENKSE